MARFVAVPHEWTHSEAEAYQRAQAADGVIRGAPHFDPEATLPMVWQEDSLADELPIPVEEI